MSTVEFVFPNTLIFFLNTLVYRYGSITRDPILQECFDLCIQVHLYETHENPIPGDV